MRTVPTIATRFLQWQMVVVVGLSCLAYLVFGHIVARSVLLGGLLVVFPHCVWTFYFFTRKHRRPKQWLYTCYAGELLKITLTICFAVLLLKNSSIVLPAFLVGLIGAYAATIFPMMMGLKLNDER